MLKEINTRKATTRSKKGDIIKYDFSETLRTYDKAKLLINCLNENARIYINDNEVKIDELTFKQLKKEVKEIKSYYEIVINEKGETTNEAYSIYIYM